MWSDCLSVVMMRSEGDHQWSQQLMNSMSAGSAANALHPLQSCTSKHQKTITFTVVPKPMILFFISFKRQSVFRFDLQSSTSIIVEKNCWDLILNFKYFINLIFKALLRYCWNFDFWGTRCWKLKALSGPLLRILRVNFHYNSLFNGKAFSKYLFKIRGIILIIM